MLKGVSDARYGTSLQGEAREKILRVDPNLLGEAAGNSGTLKGYLLRHGLWYLRYCCRLRLKSAVLDLDRVVHFILVSVIEAPAMSLKY